MTILHVYVWSAASRILKNTLLVTGIHVLVSEHDCTEDGLSLSFNVQIQYFTSLIGLRSSTLRPKKHWMYAYFEIKLQLSYLRWSFGNWTKPCTVLRWGYRRTSFSYSRAGLVPDPLPWTWTSWGTETWDAFTYSSALFNLILLLYSCLESSKSSTRSFRPIYSSKRTQAKLRYSRTSEYFTI